MTDFIMSVFYNDYKPFKINPNPICTFIRTLTYIKYIKNAECQEMI